ncbi:MAG: FtsH protease activity modulator HflK [Proteobacteria bacterium]|nr:FtsH protease activity modulator HflK [Pseudomonadota bacterium]
MPWDQPGSGGDKDPWGQKKNNQQGPPDLDKVIKDIKEKLGLSRGGRGRGDNSSDGAGGGKNPGYGMFVVIGIVALGFWVASGFYTITQGEQGIELRLGKYKRTTEAGLHWHIPSPIESVDIINVQSVNTVEVGYRSRGGSNNTSVPREALMLTKDENIIDIQFAVLYDVKSPTDLMFNVADPIETVVRQATESAVRETIGQNSMDFAITEGRSVIASETQTLLQKILDRYQTGINVRSVEMQDAQPPSEVKDAFDDAVRAREDEQRLKNLAEAYSNDVIPRARGLAVRATQEAEAYKASVIAKAEGEASRFDQIRTEYEKAPVVTRDRLYIETMQQVLGTTSKMVIDQSQGGNSVMYLPLDKMIENSRKSSSSSGSNNNSMFTSPTGTGTSSTPGQFNQSGANAGRSANRSTTR